MTTIKTTEVSVWKLLWRLLLYQPKLYLIGCFLWVLSLSLSVVPGLIIREFFNTLTQSEQLSISIWAMIALLLATELGRVILYFAAWVPQTQHRFAMSSLIRRNLLECLLSRPAAHPLTISGEAGKTVSPGELISYFRDDAEQIQNNISQTSQLIGEKLYALFCLAILLSINAQITLFVFLPLVVMVAVVQKAETRIKRYRQASRQATQQVTGFVGEMFSSTQAIKIAGGQKDVLAYFRQINAQRRQMMLKDQLFTALLNSIFRSLASIGIGIILLLVATSMQTEVGTLMLGDFALFVYYLPFVIYAFQALSEFMALSKQSQVSFERLAALSSSGLAGKQSSSSSVSALVAYHPLYLNDLLGNQQKLPPIDQPRWNQSTCLQELTTDNLTYHYPNTNRGITNVNLKLVRGSLTVITGSIGSGKTTLLRVLLGLLPMQAGEIYWNGNRVNDPANFFVPPRSAYTPQTPKLFSASLLDNILLGLDRHEIELKKAIAMAVFEQDIAAMPEGLETVVGSRGVRLSGGQLQRAAAARMFVRQPELLVFDDLSSALDVNTERILCCVYSPPEMLQVKRT
ncbi:ABC transporter ATP-binding protein [Gloeocapsopsis sp. IPPAS B-1203]|uniref:ATP-binding cassette domain-containing protein n=1 Tax=Gloeocapsopsis sp. IPPAS B-1203 TaxID=2049454 RepID=UPI00259FF0E3|nr:ABC transporter ATP-binding protein [Gloeocapsopsis sp. IPPAS B-1203]